MSTALDIVTLNEYLKFKAPDGTKDELIEGKIVISPSGSAAHALFIKRLGRLLDDLLADSPFEVNFDLSIVVDPMNPPSMPRPDVFVMNRARFMDAVRRRVFPVGSPELAVEVVSPGNTRKKLLTKLRLYLQHGSSAVWVVYPKRRTVIVWELKDTSCEYREGKAVTLPDPLPKRLLAVSDIFSTLP